MTDVTDSIKKLEVNLSQNIINTHTGCLITTIATTSIESDVVMIYDFPYLLSCSYISNICLIVVLLHISQFKLIYQFCFFA